MKLKKIGIILLAPLTMLTATSCLGNRNCLDGCTNSTNTLHYVVIDEGGHHVLHTIESWSDSESDSAAFTTSCCGNYIWVTANNASLYRNKPPTYAYDFVCGEGSAQIDEENVEYEEPELN